MWKAEYDTFSFRFEAYGETEEEARARLLEGLQIHGKQYRLPPDWFYINDIYPVEIHAGSVFRDGEQLRKGINNKGGLVK